MDFAGAANAIQQHERQRIMDLLSVSVFVVVALFLKNTFIGDDREYQSDWYAVKNVTLLYPHLKLGDLIEYYRDFSQNTPKYSHWAVYVGTKDDENGTVHYRIIHHSTPPHLNPIDIGIKLLTSNEDPKTYWLSIREDDLVDPAHDSLFRVNNAQDIHWTPFELKEVVERARRMMADPDAKPFHPTDNNCQHLVNDCRYGQSRSLEVGRKIVDAFFALIPKKKNDDEL